MRRRKKTLGHTVVMYRSHYQANAWLNGWRGVYQYRKPNWRHR